MARPVVSVSRAWAPLILLHVTRHAMERIGTSGRLRAFASCRRNGWHPLPRSCCADGQELFLLVGRPLTRAVLARRRQRRRCLRHLERRGRGCRYGETKEQNEAFILGTSVSPASLPAPARPTSSRASAIRTRSRPWSAKGTCATAGHQNASPATFSSSPIKLRHDTTHSLG